MQRPKQGVQRKERVSHNFEGERGTKKKKGDRVKTEQELLKYS